MQARIIRMKRKNLNKLSFKTKIFKWILLTQ
jgi:hypothetical protein